MDENEFDAYIKTRIDEEESRVKQPNLDQVFEEAILKARTGKRPRRQLTFLLAAAILLFTLSAGALLFLPKENAPEVACKLEPVKQPEDLLAKVDIEKEKDLLANSGYTVSRVEIPDVDEEEGHGIVDLAYLSTLRDYVYNAGFVFKGKVLGTRYFIQNNIGYTAAKVLVEKSYDGKKQPGVIVTVVNNGAIISKYDFIIMNGIDKKFNMTESELEAAKGLTVKTNTINGGLIYPEESLVLFASAGMRVEDSGEDALRVIGPQIRYKGDQLEKFDESGYELITFNTVELNKIGTLSELEKRIGSIIVEKKGYSPAAAREAAFKALEPSEQSSLEDWEKADVFYHSEGRYLSGKKSPSELVEVSFKTKDEKYISVYLHARENKVYKVFRSGI